MTSLAIPHLDSVRTRRSMAKTELHLTCIVLLVLTKPAGYWLANVPVVESPTMQETRFILESEKILWKKDGPPFRYSWSFCVISAVIKIRGDLGRSLGGKIRREKATLSGLSVDCIVRRN